MKLTQAVPGLCMVLLLAGCAAPAAEAPAEVPAESPVEETETEAPAAPAATTLSFPEYALEVSLTLPEGWSTQMRAPLEPDQRPKYLTLGPVLAAGIYNEEGAEVGAIGAETYTETEGAEDLPQAIYSNLTLANHYNFSARPPEQDGSYQPVKETETGETALTQVYYSPMMAQEVGYGEAEHYNKGILSYDRELLAYVAVDLDADLVSDEQAEQIAQSLVLSPAAK